MPKNIQIQDDVLEQLDKISKDFEDEVGVEFSYNKTIKKIIKDSGKWSEQKIKNPKMDVDEIIEKAKKLSRKDREKLLKIIS